MQSAVRVDNLFTTTPETIRALVASALPEGVSIGFDIRGEGGGSWTLVGHGADVDVHTGLLDPVDCLLRCEVADFHAVLGGKLDARRAFLDGRLRVEGDVGLVQRLNKAFRRAHPERTTEIDPS